MSEKVKWHKGFSGVALKYNRGAVFTRLSLLYYKVVSLGRRHKKRGRDHPGTTPECLCRQNKTQMACRRDAKRRESAAHAAW